MNILITGISGQDGLFLTRLLLKKFNKIKIVGISSKFTTIKILNLLNLELKSQQKLEIINLNLLDKIKVSQLIMEFNPDFIYNLTGPSSVYESFLKPNVELEIYNIFENLISACIENRIFPRFFQASTSEMYGLNNNEIHYNENSVFKPNSPYARGKLKAHNKVSMLKEEYSWKIYSGIMFNHESEFRKDGFLFSKIIDASILISAGQQKTLILGSLEYIRDWSYANDIVLGMYKIVNFASDESYVLGSGIGTEIKELVNLVFSYFNLNYLEFVKVDNSLLRKNDPKSIVSNPKKVLVELGWKTNYKIEDFIEKIINSRQKIIL